MSQWDYKIDRPMPGPLPFPNSRKGPRIEVEDREEIKEVLGLSDCVDIIVSPDRKNIFYEKYFRKGRKY